MTTDPPEDKPDTLAHAAKRAAVRDREGRAIPEPSLGARLGQIGILGWMTVVPALAGVLLGRALDRHFDTGVFFSAPLLMLGAALGFVWTCKWMHRT